MRRMRTRICARTPDSQNSVSVRPSWATSPGRPATRTPGAPSTRHGRAASATSTRPRTTGSDCPNAASAPPSHSAPAPSTPSPPRWACLLVPSPDTEHLQDDGGFAVPAAFRRSWDFSRDGILRSLEGSMERLGLDHIDIVYLHDPDHHWQEASTTGVDTLVELRDQGVVKAVGSRHEPGRDADRVRPPLRRGRRHGGRSSHPARPLRPGRVAAARLGARRGRRRRRGLQLRTALGPPTMRGATYDHQPASRELLGRAAAIADVCERHDSSLPVAAIAYPCSTPVSLRWCSALATPFSPVPTPTGWRPPSPTRSGRS